MPEKLFCSKPFTWFEVSQKSEVGEVFLCCPAWLDVPIGNLDRQSVEEIWNGTIAQEVRRSILDGSFKYCDRSRCPSLQTVSEPVQAVDDVTDSDMRTAIERNLTVVPWGPRDINCCYDRSCNLACPSCRTKLIVETANSDRISRLQHKITTQGLKDARLLSITGSGDPFGSPFFRKWLQTMEVGNMPRLEVIHLHSNGLLWTPRMWGTIPAEVRQLVKQAQISIDAATAATYAINRPNGRFDVLLRNLEFIGTLRKEGPLQWLGISMVVQENNFTEMPEFIRLGKRFGADTVYFSQLVDWGTFSETEFTGRAIHHPSHPRHRELVYLLAGKVFADPTVLLGNLADLRSANTRLAS